NRLARPRHSARHSRQDNPEYPRRLHRPVVQTDHAAQGSRARTEVGNLANSWGSRPPGKPDKSGQIDAGTRRSQVIQHLPPHLSAERPEPCESPAWAEYQAPFAGVDWPFPAALPQLAAVAR